MAKKESLASAYAAPRHPRAPAPGLADILLTPHAFPIARLAADPPTARGMIWKRALLPPFEQTSFQNEGWLTAYRDGLVFQPISLLQTGLEGSLQTLGEVLPATGLLLSAGALRAGKDIDLFNDLLEALGEWSAERARPTRAAANHRPPFCLAFVDLVEAALYQINYTGLDRLNNNGHATSRFLALTLEDAHGQKSGYRVIVYQEPLERVQLAFFTARIRAEIAWITKEIEAEVLGPTFWPNLFSQHTAALERQPSQPEPALLGVLLQAAQQARQLARQNAGLTEAKQAAMVLERMAPTLPGLRQAPAWDPRGQTDLERLTETAGQQL